jgi:hypothetical protein
MTEIKLWRELNLGVAEVSKTLKRAEPVFRENPGIKKRILAATRK